MMSNYDIHHGFAAAQIRKKGYTRVRGVLTHAVMLICMRETCFWGLANHASGVKQGHHFLPTVPGHESIVTDTFP